MSHTAAALRTYTGQLSRVGSSYVGTIVDADGFSFSVVVTRGAYVEGVLEITATPGPMPNAYRIPGLDDAP